MRINSNHFAEGVRVVPTPNKGGSIAPSLIIIHDTAGQLDYKTSVSWLCNPQARASAHFVIGRKGEVVQLVSCLVKTWHAGKSAYKGVQNVNDFSIGIEIANPGKLTKGERETVARASFGRAYDLPTYGIQFKSTPSHGEGWWMPYTQPQLDAVLALSLALRDKYNITSLSPHWEISPGRKIDTNPIFPLQWLRGKLEGRQDAANVVEVEIGTPLRMWPSLFSENIVHTIEGKAYGELISSGEFFPAGRDLPFDWVSNPSKKILWHKVDVGGNIGWVLSANVRMI